VNINIKTEALLEHLLLQGALEVSGMDPQTGETLYAITDKLEEVSPAMYKEVNAIFRKNMIQMMYAGPKTMTWRISDGTRG
jgi:hypothetical protein